MRAWGCAGAHLEKFDLEALGIGGMFDDQTWIDGREIEHNLQVAESMGLDLVDLVQALGYSDACLVPLFKLAKSGVPLVVGLLDSLERQVDLL